MLHGKVLWTMYNVPVMEMADSSRSVVHLIQWDWLRSKPTTQDVLEGVSVKRRLRGSGCLCSYFLAIFFISVRSLLWKKSVSVDTLYVE